ncbi:MAG: glycosyltransferase [Sphingobacteriaceae bacterium]|nr:MAG: glycosyltransferase [Sphingobacteriaceae bacterium]
MTLKLSVLTPSFNSGKYLERAIQSVLKQDYANWEHIIMDGGSTDNTLEVLKKYPHLSWKMEKDAGQADAMNKAFKASTGDIIVYLNADDYFEENVFATVIQAFSKDSTADMVVGNGINVNSVTQSSASWCSEINYRRCLQFYKYQFPIYHRSGRRTRERSRLASAYRP